MTRETFIERRARLVRAEVWSPADAAFIFRVAKSTVLRWIARPDGLPAEEGIDEAGQRVWVINAAAARSWVSNAPRRRR